MKRFAAILALVALFAGATCKKLEDGTELDIQMFALIVLLTNRNTCADRPYQNASAGQSFGPFSSTRECFYFGATGPFTARMTTTGSALGRFITWNPLMRIGSDADDPAIDAPASNDLWISASCQDSAAPWSVQF